jgi:hypothetical protein
MGAAKRSEEGSLALLPSSRGSGTGDFGPLLGREDSGSRTTASLPAALLRWMRFGLLGLSAGNPHDVKSPPIQIGRAFLAFWSLCHGWQYGTCRTSLKQSRARPYKGWISNCVTTAPCLLLTLDPFAAAWFNASFAR